MKTAKIEGSVIDFRVWCEHCQVRVAPNEERTIVHGKTYHPKCYSKKDAVAKT